MNDSRRYPQRPYLAVSAAIMRDGKVLVVRRARKPALNLYTLPGGAVETGETLHEAVVREVREETQLNDRAGRACRLPRGDRARRRKAGWSDIS